MSLFCVFIRAAEVTTSSSSPERLFARGSQVVGLASIDSQLFVLHEHAGEQVVVYDIATFVLQRTIHLPGVAGMTYAAGLASSATDNCLYASNYRDGVYRVDLSSNDAVTCWPIVGRGPKGLSVTGLSNVLVCCYHDHRLQEYTTHGSLVRDIDSGIARIAFPWHAIELFNGLYAVSHPHRVCVVDVFGRYAYSYGDTDAAGSSAGLLYYPVGLVEVRNGCILVADRCNGKIRIIKEAWTGARDLSYPDGSEELLIQPWSLCVTESRDRLYVGERWGIRVFDISHVF